MSDDPQVKQPPTPKLSPDEVSLQDATRDLDQQEQPIIGRPAGSVNKVKSHKKLWIFLIVVVLLVGFTTGAYVLLGKKEATPTKKAKTPTPVVADMGSNTFTPDVVTYAYRGSESDPFTIYNRPAASGDRKEIIKIERDEYPNGINTVGGISGFTVAEKKLYLTTDGGKTYKSIVEIEDSYMLISAYISGDGRRVAYSTYQSSGESSSSKLYSVDLAGQNRKEITTASDVAISLEGYNESKAKVAFSEGCYQCDGARSAYKLYDLKTNKSSNLYGDIAATTLADTLQASAVSSDMSTLLFIEGTVQPGTATEGIGPLGTAPYKVQSRDLISGKTTLLETIGTKGEKNTNGTAMLRKFMVGFKAGSADPYYTEGMEIFEVVDGKPKEVYESATAINQVLFVSASSLVLATAKNDTDFDLINYNRTAKKPTLILEGDPGAILFGVTTK